MMFVFVFLLSKDRQTYTTDTSPKKDTGIVVHVIHVFRHMDSEITNGYRCFNPSRIYKNTIIKTTISRILKVMELPKTAGKGSEATGSLFVFLG